MVHNNTLNPERPKGWLFNLDLYFLRDTAAQYFLSHQAKNHLMFYIT